MKGILNADVTNSLTTCFTGRVTRLVNVLSGFYPDINIQISVNEQISNVVQELRRKYDLNLGNANHSNETDDTDDFKELLRQELIERGYDEATISVWTLE